MNSSTTEEVLKEPVELPQILFSAERSMNLADQDAVHVEIAKLGKIVEGAFKEIASATGLSDKEVLRIIKDTDVEMLKDVMKDDINVDGLKEGVQESIKKISLATALETAQISEIFTAKQDADLDDIVNRLHHRAQANRSKFGNYFLLKKISYLTFLSSRVIHMKLPQNHQRNSTGYGYGRQCQAHSQKQH